MSAGSAAASPSESHDALLRALVSVVTNVTVLTALLVYFGWQRASHQAAAMGLDETLFAFTTRDLVLRSIDAVFPALTVAAVVGLGWVWLDGRVRARLGDPRWSTRLERTAGLLRWAWLVLPVLVVVVASIARRSTVLLFPAAVIVGTVLTVQAVDLRRDVAAGRGTVAPPPTWRTGLTRSLVAVVLVLSAFWVIGDYALLDGVASAGTLATTMHEQPAVTIDSDRPLGLEGPGIVQRELGDGRTRTEGLRLLHHHGATFLLVNDGWTTTDGVLFVVEDDDTLQLRVGASPPSAHGPAPTPLHQPHGSAAPRSKSTSSSTAR